MMTLVGEVSMGSRVRKLRISRSLTQRELAEMAGVTREEVDLYEHGLPVTMDSRRKILRQLWLKNREAVK